MGLQIVGAVLLAHHIPALDHIAAELLSLRWDPNPRHQTNPSQYVHTVVDCHCCCPLLTMGQVGPYHHYHYLLQVAADYCCHLTNQFLDCPKGLAVECWCHLVLVAWCSHCRCVFVDHAVVRMAAWNQHKPAKLTAYMLYVSGKHGMWVGGSLPATCCCMDARLTHVAGQARCHAMWKPAGCPNMLAGVIWDVSLHAANGKPGEPANQTVHSSTSIDGQSAQAKVCVLIFGTVDCFIAHNAPCMVPMVVQCSGLTAVWL